MQVQAIDHLSFVVPDIDAVKPILCDLIGATYCFRKRDEKIGIVADFYVLANQVMIFEQPLHPSSPIGSFLDKRGPGLHHIAVEIDDLADTLEALESKGLRIVNANMDGESRKEALIHPKDTRGILWQLIEWSEPYKRSVPAHLEFWRSAMVDGDL